MTPIALDVFADIACPWCFIGHRRLRAVLVEGPGAAFAWRHRAFELQPQLPPRGRPMDAFLAERFGSREDAAARLAGVAEQAARSGVPYDASAMRVAPNTRLAHRAVTLARGQGFEAQALDALYLAHFAEGLDVTDFATIVERLADAGLPDPPALAARLAAGDGEEEVAEDEAIGAQIGVRAVPLVVADRRIVLRAAQDPATYGRFLAHAIAATRAG